jgi:hypothetical protein
MPINRRSSVSWLIGRFALILLIALIAMPFSSPGQAKRGSDICGGNSTVDTQGAKTAREARDFLAQLQAAVKANDKNQIAGMISYPLLVLRSGKRSHIRQKTAFVESYDQIFTQPVRDAVLHQSSQCLFGNDQGAMVGKGEVWFTELAAGGMKIITVNESASSM